MVRHSTYKDGQLHWQVRVFNTVTWPLMKLILSESSGKFCNDFKSLDGHVTTSFRSTADALRTENRFCARKGSSFQMEEVRTGRMYRRIISFPVHFIKWTGIKAQFGLKMSVEYFELKDFSKTCMKGFFLNTSSNFEWFYKELESGRNTTTVSQRFPEADCDTIHCVAAL